MSYPLSVLDLSPITSDGTASQSFANTRALAQTAERLGYRRFWLAEHHGTTGIGSAATAVLIGNVAEHTKTIRVGAGGIMLPNHSPLVIAEQFGTLEALYPDRIDLGLGRAPGSDQATVRAMRRDPRASEEFPQDVAELIDFMADEPQQSVRAVPGRGAKVPVWILGSSLFGAQLAAAFGLPFAFASHFAPQMLMEALAIYRSSFRPSQFLDKPHAMAGLSLYAADTDEEARYLASSQQQVVVNRRMGKSLRLPPPVAGYTDHLGPQEQAILDSFTGAWGVGSPDTISKFLRDFLARTKADELIVATAMHDLGARLRSYELVAEVATSLA